MLFEYWGRVLPILYLPILHVTILAFCQPAQLNQLVAIWMLICGFPVSIIAPARSLQPKLTKNLSLAAGCVIIFNMVLFISLSIGIGCVNTCASTNLEGKRSIS